MKKKYSNSRLVQHFNLLGAFALLIALALPTFSYAQDSQRIGVVDFQKLMQHSKAAESIRDQVEKEKNGYQKQIESIEKKLKSSEEELVKQKSILSDDAFVEKRKTFEKDILSAQREVQEKKMSLERSYGEAMAKLRENILDIVKDISEKEQIAIVLPQSQVLLAATELDITDSVLKELNAKIKKVKVEFK